jgi:hypothetical protein
MVIKAGEDKANIYDEIMKLLGGAVEDALQSNMLSMIATQLQEMLPPKMTAQLEEKGYFHFIGIVCSMYVCIYICMYVKICTEVDDFFYHMSIVVSLF